MSASVSAVGLADTNTVILLDDLDPSALPARLFISAVTLAELSVGPLVEQDPARQAERLRHIQTTAADFDVLPFDEDAARSFGLVSAAMRQRGRKVTARAYDALIAATAVSRGLPLYTCNPEDFDGIDGLDVVAVPHPRSA